MDSGPLIQANGQSLREVQPAFAAEFQRQLGPSLYATLPSQESVLREYLRVLIKRRWIVLASVIVIFGVVFCATMRATRIYDASGSIAINKSDPMMFNFRDSANSGMGYSDTTDIDTEIRILKSDLLALQVIKELGLDKRADFGGTAPATTQGLALTTDALQPDSQQTSNLINTFKKRLHLLPLSTSV